MESNLTEYDIISEFDRLNKLLFDNKLNTIKLKWTNVKKSGGKVVYNIINNKNIIQHLEISTFYKMNYDRFINILLHEMIHVYILQNNINMYGNSHGQVFLEMMLKFNKLGYNVTIKDDVTDMELSTDKNLTNPVLAILIYDRRNNVKSIAVYNFLLYTTENVNKINNVLKRNSIIYNTTYDIYYIKTNNINLKKYTICRTLKIFTTNYIPDELYDNLLKDYILEEFNTNNL